jgi:hypothetical protein
LSKAKLEGSSGGTRAERRARANKGFQAEIELLNERTTQFEFANCIREHNLTYLLNPQDPTSEALLDFKVPEHVKMLDVRVGQEIDELITDFNNFDVEDDESDVGK